jgi:hypothetical protein
VYIGNTRIPIEALMDSGALGGNYVNHETAQLICVKEGISPVALVRKKEVTGYDGVPGPSVEYVIYLKLFF